MVRHENILGVRDVVSDGSAAGTPQAPVRTKPKSTGTKRKLNTPLSAEEVERKQEQKAARAQALAESKKRILVGLDFGTTYSGIAYVSSGKEAKDVDVLTKWTGGQNEVLEKVPSRIAYASANDFDSDLWGYQVKPGMTCTQWFKLLLDKETNPSDFDDPLLAKTVGEGLMALPDGKTAKDVARDYLKFLYHHTLNSLKSMMGAAALAQTPILFELTLPATWSHSARETTRNAAIHAGFDSRVRDEIVLIDEPEAAAISVMRSTVAAFDDLQPFKAGHSVMVVDMGGGTVDLCTFLIKKVEPLQLEEACVGEGGKCGSTTIDRNFHVYLRNKFGTAFTELPLKRTASGSIMMNAFEDIKREFGGGDEDGRVFEVPLAMKKLDENDADVRAVYDFEENLVRFSSDDLETMFQPVLEKTFKLIQGQLKRTRAAQMPAVKTLVLCGGLGSSPYVKKRVDAFAAYELKRKVEVITPRKPWSAIARGAAIRALEKEPVLFRRSRDNIGICVHEAWDENKHRAEDYWRSPIFGERARNQMRWHVLRGEKIRPSTKKIIECSVGIEKVGHDNKAIIVYQDLYACADDDAPQRLPWDLEPVGRIKMDLTNIIRDERKKIRKANGSAVPSQSIIDVNVELSVASDKGVLEVKGKVKRKVIGSTLIEWFAAPDALKR